MNLPRLTQTVQKGGCAAKVSASELRQILKQVHFPATHKELMVDGGLFDDAAIYKVNSEVALVQTLDFFTPIIDTPKVFGQIAATNALSDVYAMGGRPKTAMAILAYPTSQMDSLVIADIIQGACDQLTKANANLVGGHSIDDDTLKFGLSVTGYVHPEKVWTNAGALVGDDLILTKPLGTGALCAALKRSECTEHDIIEAVESMCTLNNVVDFLSQEELRGIHAATDITGFGLSGHSMQMANASEVTFRVNFSSLPYFQKVFEFIEKGFLTKAHRTNDEYTQVAVDSQKLSAFEKKLVHDPQTSGGLLLSVEPSLTSSILKRLTPSFKMARVVGRVEKRQPSSVIFEI